MKSVIRSLALGAAMLCAASAQAIGPARVGNAYYEDIFQGGSCSAGSCLEYSFSTTPMDAYVRIKHVACLVINPSTIPITRAILQIWNGSPGGTNSQLLKYLPIPVPEPRVESANNVYAFNSETLLLAGPGRYIALSLQSPYTLNATTSGCGITGDLIPPQ
ncbi:MAG: hypothetical protein JO004_07070 [Methylobacteriaceae bacterium]|nr:hypothetical protein [Methylobacteriaceae bacterium]